MFTRKGLAGFGEREMLGRTQGGAHGGGVWAARGAIRILDPSTLYIRIMYVGEY